MKRALAASITAAALLAAAPVLADAVPSPPTDCPAGSQGETCHGGPYCAPLSCTADTDCQNGDVCQPLSYCATTITCAGGWNPPDASVPSTQVVRGLCADGCADGVTCATINVCAPRDSGSSSGGSGGCSWGGGPATAGAMLSVMAAAAAVLARRRRSG